MYTTLEKTNMNGLQKKRLLFTTHSFTYLVKGQDSPDSTELQVQKTAMAESVSYRKIYLTGLEKVVLEFVIPLATLTVLNILLLNMVS